MFRVMPWAYPTIPGQSTGGIGTDPIPSPAVDPYDFTNATVTFGTGTTYREINNQGTAITFCSFPVTVSGVETIDSTNVSNVKIVPSSSTIKAPAIGNVASNTTFYTSSRKQPNGTANSVSAQWIGAASSGSELSLTGSAKITIEVYDSAGTLIQSADLGTVSP